MSGGGTGLMSGGGESITSGTPMGSGLLGCSIMPSLLQHRGPRAQRAPPGRVRYWSPVHMLAPLFHRWERRLAALATDRLVRPFQWGDEWVPSNGHVRPAA